MKMHELVSWFQMNCPDLVRDMKESWPLGEVNKILDSYREIDYNNKVCRFWQY